MAGILARGVASFLVPGGLLFAAAIILVQQINLETWIPALSRLYPYTVFAVALLLGWRFDRSRLVFAAAVLALADRLLLFYGTRPDYIGTITFNAAAVLLPLNLALLALFKERGIVTWRGLVRWSLILVQPVIVGLLIHYRQFDLLGVFDARILTSPSLEQMPLSQPALLSFALSVVIVGVNAFRQRSALENGFFWALVTVLVAFLSADAGPLLTVYLATAILILVVAVVEISYRMAFRDELTGLRGRRALNQALLKLGHRYTIAMLDIDHFKKFNDRYGHDVGDEVLRMVATQLARVSGGGKAYRYGGEEFTVVFPGKHVDEVLSHLEELREAIASSDFVIRRWNRPRQKPKVPKPAKNNKRVQITISIGAAERGDGGRTPQEVIKAADKALYRAKEGGRNRVST